MLVRDNPTFALLPESDREAQSIAWMRCKLVRRAAAQERVCVRDVLPRRHIELDNLERPTLRLKLEKGGHDSR
jgi:hypothetical protein